MGHKSRENGDEDYKKKYVNLLLENPHHELTHNPAEKMFSQIPKYLAETMSTTKKEKDNLQNHWNGNVENSYDKNNTRLLKYAGSRLKVRLNLYI